MKTWIPLIASFFLLSSSIIAQQITEIDYDVVGTDVAGSEKLEVFFPTGSNPNDFSIIRINGSTPTSGVVYTTPSFSTVNCSAVTGGQVCVYTGSQDCLQNGANDAVILYNTVSGSVASAIAYEGNVTVSSAASPSAIQNLVIISVGTDNGSNANESLNDDNLDGIFVLTTSNFGALPIELKSFNVKTHSTSTLLSFSTATETNNSHFVIERSADARTFSEIGQVRGAGTTQEQHDYTFTDDKPLSGRNYYRLRQVDFDGTESFSPVVSVVFGKSDRMTFAPSPATDRVRIQLDEALRTDGAWQVYDNTGRQVLSGTWEAESADLNLEVNTLPEGMYTFRLTEGAAVQVKQFRKL